MNLNYMKNSHPYRIIKRFYKCLMVFLINTLADRRFACYGIKNT